MKTTLCTQCFPDGDDVEVYCMIPITGCQECGVYDDRFKGGPKVHYFPNDPRIKNGEVK